MASKATNPVCPASAQGLAYQLIQRTNSRLQRVSNNQGCASSVPLVAEWRPRQFLAIWEPAIELGAGFRD